MAMTVRRLIAVRKLGLSLVAGRAGLDRTITWAHANELADPSPWLSGGELVMTTGLHFPTRTAASRVLQLILDQEVLPLRFRDRFQKPLPPVCAAATAGFRAGCRGDDAVRRHSGRWPRILPPSGPVVQQLVEWQENFASVAMHVGIPALLDTLSRTLLCGLRIDRSGVVRAVRRGRH